MSRPESVSSRIGHPRLQHRHLQDLEPLLLSTREPVVDVARRELARNLELVHRRQHLLAKLGHRHRVVLAARPRLAHGIDGRAEKACNGDARDRVRVLEGEEEASLRTLVRAHLDEVLAVEEDLALGDHVTGMTHQRVGEGRLARAVRPHDGVDLVPIHGQIDARDDLSPVFERDVQIVDLEHCHFVRSSPPMLSGKRAGFVTDGSGRAFRTEETR